MPDALTRRLLEHLAHYTESEPEAIPLEASFEDLGLDSIDSLSLIGDLEDAFGISISNDEAYGITSVRQALELLRRRVDGGESDAGGGGA